VDTDRIHALCEQGQQALMATRYLDAEAHLVQAEALALAADDFDALARLYMPLQEARRQRRQLCGEGTIRLDLLATGPDDEPDGAALAHEVRQGQLLVAGWGQLGPSLALRQAAADRQLYVESYLAAVYPIGDRRAVALVPHEADLPKPEEIGSPERLLKLLPPHSVVLHEDELPAGPRQGDAATFAQTMALWERLHAPFLAAAAQTADPRQRLAAYRRVIEIDYACEKAHQWLSGTAGELDRATR
jgi:hypothetical protein